jgi:hypothetical protein
MKKIILSIGLLLIANFLLAQNAYNYKNQIKFSPLRTINWFNPGLELGYQRNYGHFATQISGAYLIDVWGMNFRDNVQGYRFSLEEKYNFPKSYFKRQKTFISCEIGYNNINSTRLSQRFILKDNQEQDYENSYIDDYEINRKSIMFDVKVGMEFQIKHLLLEWEVGLGVAYQNVKQLNKKNHDYEMGYGIHDFISIMFEGEGKKVIPNIPLSLKIGYVF